VWSLSLSSFHFLALWTNRYFWAEKVTGKLHTFFVPEEEEDMSDRLLIGSPPLKQGK
jgi:hypothetical protein